MLQKLALYPLLNFFCSNLTRKQKQNCNTLHLNVYVKSTLSGTLHIQKALHLVYNSSRSSMERLCVRAWERYSEGVSEWSLTDVMEPQRSSYLGNAECLSRQAEWEARRVPSGCQSVAHAPFFHALPPSLLRSLWIREEEWDWERTRRTNKAWVLSGACSVGVPIINEGNSSGVQSSTSGISSAGRSVHVCWDRIFIWKLQQTSGMC